MKQTIEVEVRNGAEEGEYVVVWPSGCTDDCGDDELRQLGLTAPAPEPEHTEYALYRLDKNGHHVTADEVLVAAHSLRVGDRIEWAPGDWREITKVELNDPEHAIHTFYVGDQPATYRGWDLLAVRR